MCKIALVVCLYAFILTFHQCVSICDICNSNGVACASNNTFHLCFGGLPNIGEVFKCPNENEVCTTLGQVCMDPDSNPNIRAACGNTKQCGQCADVMDGGYTCTSRTTFTMCMDSSLTNIRGSCRGGQVCRTSGAHTGIAPCVSECLADFNDMCDVNVAVDTPPSSETEGTTVIIQPTPPLPTTILTTTPTSTTTEEVSTNTPASVASTTSPSLVEYCSSQRLVGRYLNSADSSCTTYLYCSRSGAGAGFNGRIMRCPTGRFFNPQTRVCQFSKPNGCI